MGRIGISGSDGGGGGGGACDGDSRFGSVLIEALGPVGTGFAGLLAWGSGRFGFVAGEWCAAAEEAGDAPSSSRLIAGPLWVGGGERSRFRSRRSQCGLGPEGGSLGGGRCGGTPTFESRLGRSGSAGAAGVGLTGSSTSILLLSSSLVSTSGVSTGGSSAGSNFTFVSSSLIRSTGSSAAGVLDVDEFRECKFGDAGVWDRFRGEVLLLGGEGGPRRGEPRLKGGLGGERLYFEYGEGERRRGDLERDDRLLR